MENCESITSTAPPLPLDDLVAIFQFLDTKSKGRVAQVCASWREAADSPSVWQGIEVELRSEFLNAETSRSITVRGLKRLHVLSVTPSNRDNVGFIDTSLFEKLTKFFQGVPKINSLNLADCLNLSSGLLETMICNLPCLRELNLSGCPRISEQRTQTLIMHVTSVQTVYIDVYAVHGLHHLPESEGFYPHVRRVFENNELVDSFIESLHFESIATMKRELDRFYEKFIFLVCLDLGNSISEPNDELKHLSLLNELERLNLAFSVTLTDIGLEHVTRITNLKYLDLTACLLITNDGCTSLPRLINLIDLNLCLCLKISDASLKHLNQISSLRKLNLHSCRISNLGLSYLTAGDLKLTELNLTCCYDVGDEGMSHLCQSSFNLQDLHLSFTSVTYYGIKQIIENFPHLQDLKSKTLKFISNEGLQKVFTKFGFVRDNVLNEYEQDVYARHGNPSDTVSDMDGAELRLWRRITLVP